ncbi:MAG: motility-associated protein [Porticoccaceae bacterium]
MDILTLIGIAISVGAILGGNALEGGHIGSLLQLTAFIIVMGGTVGAVLVQTQMAVFLHALKLAVWVFKPPPLEIKAALDKILQWSQWRARKACWACRTPPRVSSMPSRKRPSSY